MNNGYYYSWPSMSYINYTVIEVVAAILAVILGIVLFFTFFKKKNEGKFTGFKGTLYNVMNCNRFYVEDIMRFIYILAVCVCTVLGVVTIVIGSFLPGFLLLVAGNIVLRVIYELIMMFIMLCRKSVSIDRRLAKLEEGLEKKKDGETKCQDRQEDPQQ